jgi:hypothetical protein
VLEVESELPEPGQRDWHALYDHLRERHDNHVKSAVKRNVRYKRMATWLHILIPLLSLTLTILATSSFPYQHAVTAGAAVALTILTGTNYTLEPARRYHAFAEICVQLHDWMFETECEVEKLSAAGAAEGVLIDYLVRRNLDFSAIGRAMASLPVPRERLG